LTTEKEGCYMQPLSKAKNKFVLNNTKEKERKEGIKEEKNKDMKARKRNINSGVQEANRPIDESSYEQRKGKESHYKTKGLN